MPNKTTRVLLVMAFALAVPYASPRLRRFRVVHAPWDHTEEYAVTEARVVPQPVTTVGETKLHETQNNATITNALPEDNRVPLDAEELARAAGSVAIEDEASAMSAFYKHLGATIRGDKAAVTRILHYGDSVVASDYISGTMRRRMQERFGDVGHGWLLIANPWEWYFHNDVGHRASGDWTMSRITGPLTRDGLYGLGGVSFHTAATATATFSTLPAGLYGRNVSRFDVFYLEQPNGGDFQMEVKDQAPVRVSTRGDAPVSRKASISIPDGAGSMTVRTLGGGDVRMFGVVMEREGPGVAYDALGALGGRASLWQSMNGDHWKEQLALRDPALIVVQYGTNESEDGGVNEPQYRKFLGDLIDRLKVGAPNASILVAAPLDRAEKDEDGNYRSNKVIVRLVELQREIAKAHEVAFWNTWRAMGGKGSMGKWVKKGLANSDLTHPSPPGSALIGDLMFKAVVTGYDAYASRNKDAPVRDASAD